MLKKENIITDQTHEGGETYIHGACQVPRRGVNPEMLKEEKELLQPHNIAENTHHVNLNGGETRSVVLKQEATIEDENKGKQVELSSAKLSSLS